MDLKQLTEEMNRFVKSKGWYESGSPDLKPPRIWQFPCVWNLRKCWSIFNGGKALNHRANWKVNWQM